MAAESKNRIQRLREMRSSDIAKRLSSLRDDTGASLVEIAIASCILFALVFGIFEVSLALYSYDYITEASREAARYAIVRGSQCSGFSDCPHVNQAQLTTYVQNLGFPGINTSNVSVNASWYTVNLAYQDTSGTNHPTTMTLCSIPGSGSPKASDGSYCDNPTTNEVQVQVVYTFPFNIPFVQQTPIQMQSTSSMVISQ